jgi:hypothetical protein
MKGKESPRKKGNKKKGRFNQVIFSLLLIIPGLGKPSSSHVGSFFFPPQGLHIFLCLFGSSQSKEQGRPDQHNDALLLAWF